MFPEYNLVDEIIDIGDPWHGLFKNGALALPNGGSRALLGASPLRGDTFAVKVPSQPAANTTAAETAQGKEWLNYGLIAGENHVIYGAELGAYSWLYVAPDKSVWLATYYNSPGSVSFKRFGVFDGTTAAVAQTVSTAGMDPAYTTRLQDISPTGAKFIISSETVSTAEPCSRARIVFPLLVREFTISGIPPAASVSSAVMATAEQCQGIRSNSRMKHTQYTYWTAAPDPEDTRPLTDPAHFFLIGTETSHVYTYSTPTDSPVSDPGPTISGGRIRIYMGQGYKDPATGVLMGWSMPAGGGDSITNDGAKSITGAVLGASFSGGETAQMVTVDVTLTDAVSNQNLSSVTYARSGTMTINVGASVLYSLPFSWSATAVSDAGYSALSLNLAGIVNDSDPSHASALRGGEAIAPIELWYDDKHLVLSGPNPYGSTYQGPPCARFIPVRYTNNVYGFTHIHGAGWHLYRTDDDPWWEQTTPLTENHHAKSVFGGAEKTLSIGSTGGAAFSSNRYIWASCQPVKNLVELHTDAICFK